MKTVNTQWISVRLQKGIQRRSRRVFYNLSRVFYNLSREGQSGNRTVWLFRKAFKHSKFLFYILTARVTTKGCKSPNKPHLGHPPRLPRSCMEAQAWAPASLPELCCRHSCVQPCCPDLLIGFSRLIPDPVCLPYSGLVKGSCLPPPPCPAHLTQVLWVCALWVGTESCLCYNHTQLLSSLMEQPQSYHSLILL